MRRFLEGIRNLVLALAFLAWVPWMLWLLRPPTGYTPELIAAWTPLIYGVAGFVFAAILGRAANKLVERWPVKPPGGKPKP